jgi:hypothetical protein
MSPENPYQPPGSPVGDPGGEQRPGNTVESGLSGDYQLRIGEVISEAWQLTKGMKASFWGAVFVVGLVAVIISVLLNFAGVLIAGSVGALEANFGLQYAINLIINALLAPLGAGILMMGVRRAAGLSISFDTVFAYLGLFVPLAILVVLQTLLTNIGYLLLILPGIYLAVAYTLSFPLAVDRRFRPWQAMETSRRAITRRWFEVFVLLLVTWLIMVAGIITIIGWIWTGPLVVNVHGILYREVFGVAAAREGTEVGGAHMDVKGGFEA